MMGKESKLCCSSCVAVILGRVLLNNWVDPWGLVAMFCLHLITVYSRGMLSWTWSSLPNSTARFWLKCG
jgi:hypothetical protein